LTAAAAGSDNSVFGPGAGYPAVPAVKQEGLFVSYQYKELKHKRMADLRQIASGIEHEAVKGYTQLNKQQLLDALCAALSIDKHEHHDVVGVDKRIVKTEIRELKKKRDEAVKAHNHSELKSVRRQIHKLKRTIRKALV
jgi:rubrerythrin